METMTKEWIELVIAATIGTNLALYEMTDPEGEERADMLRKSIHETMETSWVIISQADEDMDHLRFAKTAVQICTGMYSDFICARMEFLLINGMPAKPLIHIPH